MLCFKHDFVFDIFNVALPTVISGIQELIEGKGAFGTDVTSMTHSELLFSCESQAAFVNACFLRKYRWCCGCPVRYSETKLTRTW